MMSFETDTIKSQTNLNKNEEKLLDSQGMMPQNSVVDNHSFNNYEPTNFFIEPMGENSLNKISTKNEVFDETDDTDYEYMGLL